MVTSLAEGLWRGLSPGGIPESLVSTLALKLGYGRC
jgi:hypothetical protein